MRDRLPDWWLEYRLRRDPGELLADVWMVAVAVALFVGFTLGWLARG